VSQETFNPNKFRGVTIQQVFESQSSDGSPFLTKRISAKFSSVEQVYVGKEGLLFSVASAIAGGDSLRTVAGRFGVTHKNLAALLQAAKIPYATRAESVQKLWTSKSFRERNAAAVSTGFTTFRTDSKRIEAQRNKISVSVSKRWLENDDYRAAVRAGLSERSKTMWADPAYRAKQAQHFAQFGGLNADPEIRRRVSETKKAQWTDPDFYAAHVEVSRKNLADTKTKPSYRKKRSELAIAQRNDSDYRSKMMVTPKDESIDRSSDPEYLSRRSEQRRAIMLSLWQDDEYREKQSEAHKRLWTNDEYRDRMTEQARQTMKRLMEETDFMERGAEARHKLEENPEFQAQRSERQRQIMLELWTHDDYRAKRSAEQRHAMLAMWKNDDFRAKRSEAQKDRWKDTEYRAFMLAMLRRVHSDPELRSKIILPSHYGYRTDIDFHAQSAWEANIARLLRFTNRPFILGESVKLTVTDEFAHLFEGNDVYFNLDFMTSNRRGQDVAIELMAHPHEDPEGWAKFFMAQEQYPNLVLKAIEPPLYRRLARIYAPLINASSEFIGWEKTGFNLRTHPELFGAEKIKV